MICFHLSTHVCVDTVACMVACEIITVDTPLIIANGDAVIVPCLLQRKVRITYNEVKLHKVSIRSTTTRPTFMSL